ncbi:type IX secretion system outer membrane channel protein PorV [Emticicia sp.]|uniref:type IX secretion system outer membrane channel protein PorV n=1 Tax=Emticicia sp. TaxID=1930953 RepID=UPI00375229B6
MKNIFRFCVGLSLIINLQSIGQVYTPVNSHRVLVGAFPFQNFTYDARSAALGEAGIAISPDANSGLMNPAKLAFLNVSKDSSKKENPFGISLHYTPYYRNLIQGMNLYALNTFKFKNNHAYGLIAKYFDAGNVEIRNQKGIFQRNFASKEFSIAGFYAKQLKHNNSFSVGLKYIYSDLSATIKPVNVFAGDLCFYHDGREKKRNATRWLNYGASLTNIGGRVSYDDYKKRTFQPTLLKLGAAQNFILGKKQNILMLTIDANKLLVPTPSIRNAKNEVIAGKNEENITGIGTIFQSWATAPDGLRETMREFTFSMGSEFQFRAGGVPHFYARAGYYTQNKRKGDIHYFTLGLGAKFKDFGLDLSYLISNNRNEILSNTFRASLNYCPFK